MFSFGIDLTSWISWPLICGGVVALGGIGVLIVFVGALNGTKIIRVPDGVAPDEHYRRWKASAWTRRVSRGAWFLLFLALGLVLGGCGVSIMELVR